MRITINMPDEMLNAYRALAEERKTTIAAVLREVLAANLSASAPSVIRS